MQQKAQEDQDKQIIQQAKDNVHRQQVELSVEDTQFENRKVVDQANEAFKRKNIGKVIEAVGGLDNN